MPKIRGPKAYTISGIIRDIPDTVTGYETGAYMGVPHRGIEIADDIDLEELEPHFFTPNFLRPVPTAEEDPEDGSSLPYDISNDVSSHIQRFRRCT
jgi:hypothetical protein